MCLVVKETSVVGILDDQTCTQFAVKVGVLTHVIAGRSGRLSTSWADCQQVGQTVRDSGRLSEIRADCHKVGQTVIKSGRLSESGVDCQQVEQTVRKSGRLSENRQNCQRSGDVVMEATKSSWKWQRRLITMTASSLL